ncbi:hypothetical protein MSAN_00797600 [Mycena sanguinolenta]|uniref:F-box domain-containing protein n=1 Tax=Mycena sanguinolenta TaxID=230812 RepID=A0A8H6YY43_9AGAR|nr:hypothetical protein MSAN_00797600 [Mycena sanguinolenta]
MVPESTSRPECFDCGKAHPPRSAFVPSPFHDFIVKQETMSSASDRAAVHDFILAIDTEIAQRAQTIDRLRCEMAILRRHSEQHKSIIAPIRRVPPEIMAEIFLHLTAIEARPRIPPRRIHPDDGSGCANFFEKNDMVRPIPHRAPLIFGEVSRQWRAIALSTPRLWNAIFITSKDEKLRDYISLCDTWLKRSGSLPLSIRFHRACLAYREPSPPQHTVDGYEDLFRTILPYAQRWRLLDFANIPTSAYDVFQASLPNSLPLLEALSVDPSLPVVSSCNPWARLRSAPKLRFLRHTIGDTRAGGWQTFPWSQLTHIDLENCSVYDCHRILSETPTAVDCKFIIERLSPIEHPPVFHPVLKILRMEAYTDIHLRLTCPRLSTLGISILDPEVAFHDLSSFLDRSGACIEKFTLEESNIHIAQFTAWLAAMSRIRHLGITQFGEGQLIDDMWESLTWRSNFTLLVPELESLEFLGGKRDFSHQTLARMLKSRVQTPRSPVDFVPKLNAVKLSFWKKLSNSAYRRLIAFRKFGLKIDVQQNVDGLDESDSEDEESDSDDGDNGSEDEETDSEDDEDDSDEL